MPVSALPFDDIRNLLAIMPGALDASGSQAVVLGKVGALARFVRAWRGPTRELARPVVALFAGSHGLEPERSKAQARARMTAISAGTAPVAQLCQAADIGLRVFELALDHPTGDMSREAAFEEVACAATIAYGMEAIAGGADLLCVGALGPGADLEAAAICLALFGGAAADWLPQGAEPDAAAADRRAIDDMRRLHLASQRDPLEILRRIGGREIAAMVGAVLAARMERTPVLLDGLPAAAAAAILFTLDHGAVDHCLAAQAPENGPLRTAFARMSLTPLLDLGVDATENCGACLAAELLKTIGTLAG